MAKNQTEHTYEEVRGMLLDVAGRMDYDEVIDFHEEVTKLLRRKAYAEGYTQARFDSVAEDLAEPQPLTRDDIVEKAKADLDGGIPKDGMTFGGTYGYDVYGFITDVEFIVNSDKRTVVALLRGVKTGIVLEKGIAKCDPNDCFNEFIGKAIALRRALGKDVPDEYLNAPEPEGVEVGDIVQFVGPDQDVRIRKVLEVEEARYLFTNRKILLKTSAKRFGLHVIDDSARHREGDAQ